MPVQSEIDKLLADARLALSHLRDGLVNDADAVLANLLRRVPPVAATPGAVTPPAAPGVRPMNPDATPAELIALIFEVISSRLGNPSDLRLLIGEYSAKIAPAPPAPAPEQPKNG